MQSVNPYRPSQSPNDIADSEDLTFDGQVHATDISNVLQASARKVLMAILGLSVIAPMLMLPSTRSVAGFAVMIVFTVLVGVIAVVINNRTPITGILQRNPKVVGAIDGWLADQGCFIRLGGDPEIHLLTWSACKRVHTNRYGVRIYWGLDRVIILPFHCFSAFEATKVRNVIRRFKSNDKSAPSYRVLIDWGDCERRRCAIRDPDTNRQQSNSK